jgi:uncharacterized protein
VKVILDTNVLVSGVFFNGPLYRILLAWREGALRLVISPEILEEYRRVGAAISNRYPSIDPEPILDMIAGNAEMCDSCGLDEPVCDDPDDDKFLACALDGACGVIVSGDRHLLRVSGYRGVQVVRPGEFVRTYLY